MELTLVPVPASNEIMVMLEEKLHSRSLKASDLVALVCRMNDPLLWFITMNADFPHGETCLETSDTPPSFYVSEPAGIPELHIGLEPYSISFHAKELQK